MSFTTLRCLVVLTALSTTGAAAAEDLPCSKFIVAAGRSPELRVVNGRGELRAVKRGSRVVVELDGRRVPASRLQREGDILKVRDADGDLAFMIGVFGGYGRDGQLAYTPDLDPWSLRNRYGFTTAEVREDVVRHLRLERREPIGVGEVCHGSAAESAGLSDRDLIVGLGGDGVGAEALERAAGAAAGQPLLLNLLRAGRPHRLQLAAGPVGGWPSAAELERYLRAVVHE